jgi:DNA-binding IclR family transcriptional regulator
VREAREKGYAVDAGNYVKGVSTVSAAVLDEFGKAAMAISAVGFSAQVSGEALERLGVDLRDRAALISRALSGGRA